MPNFTGKSGGGPHHMKKYGQGKSPIMNLGFIKAETLKKNPDAKTMMVDGKEMPITKGGPKMKYGSPIDMYGKKGSMAPMKPGTKVKNHLIQILIQRDLLFQKKRN